VLASDTGREVWILSGVDTVDAGVSNIGRQANLNCVTSGRRLDSDSLLEVRF